MEGFSMLNNKKIQDVMKRDSGVQILQRACDKAGAKLERIQMYEDDVKVYEDLKPVTILPNNVTDLKRYRDSARVAFVENIVLADANRFSFTKFSKYLDRVIKYYERYIGATQKLHALAICK